MGFNALNGLLSFLQSTMQPKGEVSRDIVKIS